MLYKYIIKINTFDKIKLDEQLERIKLAHQGKGVGLHHYDFNQEFGDFKAMLDKLFNRMEKLDD